MTVAIHNLHEVPNLFNLGIHNYVLYLLKNGHVKYLFFDLNKYRLRKNSVLLYYRFIREFKRGLLSDIPWNNIEFIYSFSELNSKCDVLLNFNSHLGPSQFNNQLRSFNGLKIYHVNDYFWNRPGSELNKLLNKIGVDYLMGYAAHDRYCNYFQETFKTYIGKVISVPFGYSDRFVSNVPFSERKNKAVALGSVNPLRPLDYPLKNFKEVGDFYPDESWFHKFRRTLVLNVDSFNQEYDSMLPVFPEIKDFKYDLVQKFNEYKMFISDESIMNFPPAKYFEGPASGCVLFCADHPCNTDLGFKNSENCVLYKPGDINDLVEKISFYQQHQNKLNDIQENGMKFVTSKFSHSKIAESLIKKIGQLWEQ